MSLELFALAAAAKLLCSHDDLSKILGTAIDGVVGNRSDELVKTLAARIGSSENGLPANHHVQRAGQKALRETLKLLVSAVSAEIGKKPPLWEALQRHLREGSLGDRPLIEFRDFPEYQWLEKLQKLAEDERALADLHRRLPFDEACVMAAMRSDAEAEQAGRRFDETLADWLDEKLAEVPARPACLATFLREGFPLERDGRERVRPFQAWRLIFAESVKTSQEVFNILILRTLADLSKGQTLTLPDASAFVRALDEPVAFIRSALERIETKLDGLHDKVDGLKAQNAQILAAVQQAAKTYTLSGLHQLKAPPELFTGRSIELAQLVQAFKNQHPVGALSQARTNPDASRGWETPPTNAASAALVISAVNGMGGVGKTALALMAAYAVLADFPDLQFFIELGTHSGNPRSAEQARDSVLRAADPNIRLPTTPDGELDQAACWRLYAQLFYHPQTGQPLRALVLLDDAANDRQVEQLAPPPGCALLVTSRQRLRSGQPVHLDRLPPAEAAALLRKLTPQLDEGEAAELAGLCGGLPIALRIVGGYLKTHPSTPAAEYIEALKAKRLTRLREKDGDDVSAVFAFSFDKLSPAEQQAWTALSIMVSSFDRAAAKALLAAALKPRWWQRLLGRKTPDIEDLLDSFVHLNLLEHDPDHQRFDWHDLLREFAAAKLESNRAETARTAHARHYAAVAQQSHDLYQQGHDSMMQGLALFDRERPQLEAAFAYLKTRPDLAETLLVLVDGVAFTGYLRFIPQQQISWLEAQVQAARQMGNRPAEGWALGNLGVAYKNLGKLRKAIEHYEQQLLIACEIEDRRTESAALGNLGVSYCMLDESLKGISYFEQQLLITRKIIDRRGEGNALGSLGCAYADLGELSKAIEYHEQALIIDREIGNRHGEGQSLGNLGNAYAHQGEPRKAIEYYEQRLVIARDIGDRRGEGTALWNAALAYEDLGERGEAIPRAEQALAILEAIEDPLAAQVRATLAEWKSQP